MAGSGGTASPSGGGAAGSPSGAGTTSQGGAGGTIGGKACQGNYGPLTPVFTEPSPYTINGPSVTADELQLFYSRGGDSGPDVLTQLLFYRTRTSTTEAFGGAQPLPELADVCMPEDHVNPDISEDGLTLYVTCTKRTELGLPEGTSQLRVARRKDRASPFVLDAEPVGAVFASAGLSADELTAYTGGEIWGTAPQLFSRSSKAEKFGANQPVPGFTSPLNSPDISADGLTLFGAAPPEPTVHQLVWRATRSSLSEDFGPASILDFGFPDNIFGAPNVVPSCSLYMVMIPAASSGMGSVTSVQVARPQ